MYNELLPDSVNVFLDDVEASLCLPIVLLIVLCTVQLTSRHLMQIGYTLWTFLKNKPQSQLQSHSYSQSCSRSSKKEKAKDSSILKKLKGIVCQLFVNGSVTGTSRRDSKAYNNDDDDDEWDCCNDSREND